MWRFLSWTWDDMDDMMTTRPGMAPVADMGHADLLRHMLPPRWPCYLARLPNELHEEICQILNNHPKSLARYARTCRGLNGIATPILYRDILYRGLPTMRQISSLLLSLYISPERRDFVRSIRFQAAGVVWHGGYIPPYVDLDTVAAVIQELFDIDPHHESSPPFTFLVIITIFCLCPNLATLQLSTCRSTWHTTEMLLHRAAVRNRILGVRAHCALPSLQTLTVNFARIPAGRANQGMNLHSLNGLLHAAAPNLRSLTVSHPSGGTSLTARLRNLTTLRLTSSSLSLRGLRLLTRACERLMHFEFRQVERVWDDTYLPPSAGQVVDCLEPCKGTLQTLFVQPMVVMGWEMRQRFQGREWPLMGPLGEFKHLRKVAVDLRGIQRFRDRKALVVLLRGCEELQQVLLLEAKGLLVQEFAEFAWAVERSILWPRLSKLSLQEQPSQPADMPYDFEGRVVVEPMVLEDRINNNVLEPDSPEDRLRRAGVNVVVRYAPRIGSFPEN